MMQSDPQDGNTSPIGFRYYADFMRNREGVQAARREKFGPTQSVPRTTLNAALSTECHVKVTGVYNTAAEAYPAVFTFKNIHASGAEPKWIDGDKCMVFEINEGTLTTGRRYKGQQYDDRQWGAGSQNSVYVAVSASDVAEYHVRLMSSGVGADGGVAWKSMIQKEDGTGNVIDDVVLGAGLPNEYVLYMTKAENGAVGSPEEDDIVIALPDPHIANRWLGRPKAINGFECGGCGWLEDLPTKTCFKFRMNGGEGRCGCIPSEGFSGSGSGVFVDALTGWLATQMKNTCCGCGAAILYIDSEDCRNSTVTLKGFHVSCESGSGGGGVFDLVMKFECSGINPITGKRFARFVAKGTKACDGVQAACGNSFYLTVECYDCPEAVCGCCCTDYSPLTWYNLDILGFGDPYLNGAWLWKHDDSDPAHPCRWIATCRTITSTIEYLTSDGGKVRLTHDSYIYELDRASFGCHGDNDMAYVSGGGTHPGIVTIRGGILNLAPGVYPCQLPDDLEVELISENCPALNDIVTVSRVTPGTDIWTYGEVGSLQVTVQCDVAGQFSVAATNICDADPVDITFGASSTGPPDTAAFQPLELTWNGIVVSGTPTVEGCCAEGATVTIIVREP